MSEFIYEETPSGSDVFGRPVDAPMLTRREEIVRCRDCKNCYACGSLMFCEYRRPDEPVNADGYCAWGVKRKEGE